MKGGDRSKERLIQILEDRELGFLYPMLKIETLLLEKINNNISIDELKAWIEQTISKDLLNSTDFIQSLVTWLVNFKFFKKIISILLNIIF